MSHPRDRYRESKLYRYRRHLNGGQTLRTDATEASEIVKKFIGYGFGSTSIGRAVGVSSSMIRILARDESSQIDRSLAHQLTKLTVPDVYRAARDNDQVPAIGIVRRLQAIMVIGHPMTEMIPSRSIASRMMNGFYPHVWISSHRRYAERYRELVLSPGNDLRSKRRAQRLGFVGPMSWADDAIDDPNARPESDDIEQVSLIDQIEHGLQLGMGVERIAEDLGVKVNSLFRSLDRAAASANEDDRTNVTDLIARLRRRSFAA